jgi:hypothetical protein
MDRWAWEQLDPRLEIRREIPIGALLCIIYGATAGRRSEASADASNCTMRHRLPESVGGSRRTRCGTRTRSR